MSRAAFLRRAECVMGSGGIGGSVHVGAGTITLLKGGHRWVFGVDAGSEGVLMRRLAELAESGNVPFDHVDLALVSHQLRRRLNQTLSREGGR